MNKISTLLLISLLPTALAFGQSNSFPATGNVGVGTANPSKALEVHGNTGIKGNMKIDSCLIVEDTVLLKNAVNIGGKTVIDGKTVVKGNTKLKGNAQVNGNFRLKALSSSTASANELLGIAPDGTVIRGGGSFSQVLGDHLGDVYELQCSQGSVPVWNNASSIMYIYCPGDNYRLGINTDNPAHSLQVEGNGQIRQSLDIVGATNGHAFHVGGTSHFEDNIGIGTATPAAPLDVTGNGLFSGQLAVGGSANPAAQLSVLATDKIGLNVNSMHSAANGYGLRSVIDNDKTKALAAYDSRTGYDSFVVYGDGTVYANSIKVRALPFPDYVFGDDYELRPIEELAAYIACEKKLPNMPSAASVEAEGMDVGELNRLLVEKVEELTLYLIQQNELISAMEARIKELETNSKQ